MSGSKVTFRFLTLLVCLLFSAGCKETVEERDEAVAEAEKAKAELARIKATLRETRNERDELGEHIGEILQAFENSKLKLAAVTQAQNELQDQVIRLAAQRDAAIAEAREAQAMNEELSNQLNETVKLIQEFEEWNEELQTTIQQLQEQIGQVGERADEVPYEEPNEEPEEEIKDENNV
ncbi:MAG: hypothetical protein PVJ86_05915 [Phycisphaerales bacterium]|jgi:uncharacterized coiled-coil DUF342 family protein